MAKSFKTIVYSPHREEWINENVIYVTHFDFINDFPYWCEMVKRLAKRKKTNLFIIDDADLLFKTHFDTCAELRDLVINHRHYGLAIILVTRRIQDIPTRIYGICEFMAIFALESPQVIDLLNKYANLGDLVKQLDYQSYEFILKEIGKLPIRMRV